MAPGDAERSRRGPVAPDSREAEDEPPALPTETGESSPVYAAIEG